MQALLAQVTPSSGNPDGNVQRAAAAIAGNPEVELVVFPELYLSGYCLGLIAGLACVPDGDELAPIAQAAEAASSAVMVGFPEALGDGVANSVACFDDDGSIAGVYRKTHLFGDETEAFVAGDSLLIVPLKGRRVAPLICFDMEFPEPARAVAQAGADLLVTVSANMAPFYRDHLIASQARALENHLPHLYVNRCGSEQGNEFVGGTRALSGDGEILAACDGGEELLITEVGAAGSRDRRISYLEQARGHLPVETPVTTNRPGGIP
jgi:predicted amidohydrolase